MQATIETREIRYGSIGYRCGSIFCVVSPSRFGCYAENSMTPVFIIFQNYLDKQ